jgi:hypothetical protein
MANLVDLLVDTVEYSKSDKAIGGEIKGTLKGEEKTITLDQVTGLQTYINANLSNYSVGEGSIVSDYYSVGQKGLQMSGFFSTWQGKDIVSEVLIPSILERDTLLQNFMNYKVFLTLKVSYFTYTNLF